MKRPTEQRLFTPGQWHILWALACLLAFGLGVSTGILLSRPDAETAAPDPNRVECVEVVDGDTIRVLRNGKKVDVRILGIDCPETRRGSKLSRQAERAELDTDQMLRYGEIAHRTTRNWLKGRTVTLVFPDGEIRRGSFGRLLAYVEQEGVDIGERLLLGGNAFASGEEHPRQQPYRLFEEEARQKGKGFWYRRS